MERQRAAIEIFCCYAREDGDLLNKLKRHLVPLQRQSLINLWHDHDISPGMPLEQEIERHLDNAQIILLLISPDLDWDSTAMKIAFERYDQGAIKLVPVILRPCSGWENISLGKSTLGSFQALPTDKPVTMWANCDEAFRDVADGIRRVVDESSDALSTFKTRVFRFSLIVLVTFGVIVLIVVSIASFVWIDSSLRTIVPTSSGPASLAAIFVVLSLDVIAIASIDPTISFFKRRYQYKKIKET